MASVGIVSALDVASGSQTRLLLDVRTSAHSVSPGAAEQEAATSKMWADNDSRWLLIWSCKLIAPHSCRLEVRQPPATVQDRLGGINHLYRALLKLPRECSNTAQAWQATNMRVNTHSNNTLQRGRSRFYCLREFTQQQLMAFHFSFYRAIKWHV